MRTTILAGSVWGVLWVLVAMPALGQRVQFPSTVPPASPSISVPPAIPPSVGLPPGPATVGPGPTATFDGTIQSPSSQWDPYATPGSAPPAMLQQDPYMQYGAPGGISSPGGTFTSMTKLIQGVQFDYLWMPGDGVEEFGIHDAELNVTFAVPFFYNTETPLLVTPGFAMHYWNGPKKPAPPSPTADLPAHVFDAYLDAAWNPQVTPWFGGELSFRVGVYSDFERIRHDSIRYIGKGMAVLSFSPSFKIKAGVWYLDRNQVKILPAGGLIWTPNTDIRFEILFPDPKFAKRLANYGNTEWWFTIRGEYGGDAWTVVRDNGILDSVDYNDFRCAVGLEWVNASRLSGVFEVGFAFEREIYYTSRLPEIFRPNTTVFLRGGLTY